MSSIFEKQTRLNRALLKEAEKGKLEKVKQLLEAGADIHTRKKDSKQTPLLCAVYEDNLDVASFLLKKGANVNDQSESGRTSLMYACCRGREEFFNLLLSYKPDLDTISTWGETALSDLSSIDDQKKSIRMAKVLIDLGASLELKNCDCRTALHMAAYRGRFHLVEFLVKQGANVHAQDSDGNKPVTLAKKYERHGVVDYLNGVMADSKKETVKLKDGWKLITPQKIALISEERAIGRVLTEVFNFEARTYHSISKNLDTHAESQVLKEFDEFIDVAPLEKAHEALLAHGGQAEKTFKKGLRLNKLGKKSHG